MSAEKKPESIVIEFNHDNGVTREIGGKKFHFDFELYSDAAGRLEVTVVDDG